MKSGVIRSVQLVAAGVLLGVIAPALAQRIPEYEEAPIHYSTAVTSNRADQIGLKLNDGRITATDRDELFSILLQELKIPVESQVLVFSKTSLQVDRISPNRPRAIYFSDDAYLGHVQGGLFEVALTDPELGIVFYALDPVRRTATRTQDCLSCHGGAKTSDWPGVFVRSVYPDRSGHRIGSSSSFVTRHDSPLEERWGGWYVTGRHGEGRHLGNGFGVKEGREVTIDSESGANLTELSEFFDTAPYLRSDSDIVALMVLEHQCEMHNRLSRGALRTRKWSLYQKTLDALVESPVSEEPGGTLRIVLDSETERIVEYLLFCDEVALPAGGISGAGNFEAGFRANRVVDAEGRSLKDFQLRRRLFQYRCSYMIYSEAFDNMPGLLKRHVYRRLFEVLEEPPEKYQHLGTNERRIIKQILLATKPEIEGFLRGLSRPSTGEP